MRAFDIAGYTYAAENLCPECVVLTLLGERRLAPAAIDMRAEDVLDQLAGAEAIDRYNEWTFDSDDFPKVIFVSQLEDGEVCGSCGEEL